MLAALSLADRRCRDLSPPSPKTEVAVNAAATVRVAKTATNRRILAIVPHPLGRKGPSRWTSAQASHALTDCNLQRITDAIANGLSVLNVPIRTKRPKNLMLAQGIAAKAAKTLQPRPHCAGGFPSRARATRQKQIFLAASCGKSGTLAIVPILGRAPSQGGRFVQLSSAAHVVYSALSRTYS